MKVLQSNVVRGTAAWVLIVALGLPTIAYSDTYNFIFSKPAKKGDSPIQPEAEEQEQIDTSTDTKEAQSVEKSETVTAPEKGPIVIHNNNTITMPAAAVATEPVKTQAPASTSMSEAVVVQDEGPSPWRLGLTTMLGKDVAEGQPAYSPEFYIQSGVLSLGYSFNRSFGWNTFAGFGSYYWSKKFFAGTELELLPFRWQLSKFDPIAFGFILGGSTLAAAPGNVGSLHGGLRLNINPIKEVGITGVLRGNAAYVGLEFGLIVRL